MAFIAPTFGLYTSPNKFQATPQGSLLIAENVWYPAPSILETRRGMSQLSNSTFGGEDSRGRSLGLYIDTLMLNYSSNFIPDLFDQLAVKTGNDPWIRFGSDSFVPNGDNRMRFIGAARSVFFNPNNGIKVYDGPPTSGNALVIANTFKAIDYDGGSGAIVAGNNLTNGVTGATGTNVIAFSGPSGIALVGTIFLESTTGTWNVSNAFSSTSGFIAEATSTDYEALVLSNLDHVFIGNTITGITSQATGTITGIFDSGITGQFLVSLIKKSGSFIDGETVVASDSALLEPYFAGNAQGLSVIAVNTSNNGWQPPDSAVAYRFTICRKDRFNRITEGPPSGRTVLRNQIQSVFPTNIVLRNTNVVLVNTQLPHNLSIGDVVILPTSQVNFSAGSFTVLAVASPTVFYYFDVGADAIATETMQWQITRSSDVTCYLPGTSTNEVTADNFIRVYRSFPSPTAGTLPSDDLFECFESAFLTPTELSNGYVIFNDTKPSSQLIDPLYTSPNYGDPLSAHYRPPIAECMAFFQNRMWYANTTNKNILQFTLEGVGPLTGLQIGDTFSIDPAGNDPLTFTAATVSAGTDFAIYTDSDPGYNIQRTAQSLCQAINADPDNDSYDAYYISGDTSNPGQILIQSRDYDPGTAFDIYSSRGTAWTPQLYDLGSDDPLIASSNNRHPAGIFYSLLGLPEAVPLLNFLEVDSDNDPILQIWPLHYRLIIFKTSGIYFCTNIEPFTIQKMSDYRLLAPDSVQVLDERIYAETDQGQIVISDSGIQPISTAIDVTLTRLNSANALNNFKTQTIGLSYKSARQYLMWTIKEDSSNLFSSVNEQSFVYSTLANGYTNYTFGVNAAIINPVHDNLLIAPTDGNYLLAENKQGTIDDYVDSIITGILPDQALAGANQLVLPDGTEVAVGDVISVDTNRYIIIQVDLPTADSPLLITTLGDSEFIAGDTYSINQAIATNVTFNKITSSAPAQFKMSQMSSFLFDQNTSYSWLSTFATEITPVPQTISMFNPVWGQFNWGNSPWGTPTQQIQRVEPLPTDISQACQLNVGLIARQAFSKFRLLGIDVIQSADSQVNGA